MQNFWAGFGSILAVFSLGFGLPGCARKPSREFDAPSPVLQVPRAQETAPGEGENPGMPAGPPDRPVSLDVLSLPSAAGAQPVSPGNAPWGPTSTYVPVMSPREIPGEKVPASPSRPVLASPERREIRDPAQLPAGTPFVVAPPPIEGASMPPSP